jgi:hypothetical protein
MAEIILFAPKFTKTDLLYLKNRYGGKRVSYCDCDTYESASGFTVVLDKNGYGSYSTRNGETLSERKTSIHCIL